MNKVERKRVQAGKRVHAVFGGRESGGNAGGPSHVSATGSTSATVLVLVVVLGSTVQSWCYRRYLCGTAGSTS
jgi:hypothetical protein